MYQENADIIKPYEDSGPVIIAMWHHNLARLYTKDILFISRNKDKSRVHVIEEAIHFGFEKKVSCKMRLDEVYEILKDYGFEYAHNSYLVNLRYVIRKTNMELELIDGTHLSIARTKEKNFADALVRLDRN
ncbi:MAG: LytTR family transcriptional regulator [Clostridium sp.]|nr:LytTR family transcriptional regulator [Clostridium sp.]